MASAERPPVSAVFAEINPSAVLEAGGLDAASGLLVLLRAALARLDSEQVLDLRSSAFGVADDIQSWCRLNECHLVACLDSGSEQRFLIAKGRNAERWHRPDWGLRMALNHGAPNLRDAYIGRRAVVPERADPYLGFLPRGAVAEIGLPPYPFTLNARHDVWFSEVADLYEQSAASQWSAAHDIPWGKLPQLPDDVERAVCQLMTFLAENEYSALYVPARFLPRINAQFVEVVLFLAAVINDEARHIEVFTKRALIGGGGLQYATALTERSLLGLLVLEDYFQASFLLHVLGEGTFLDLLAFIEDHSPDVVTREIAHRARLDEGRHVAYGIGHVRERLVADPSMVGALESAAAERAATLREMSGENPFVTEALVVLAGGGRTPAQIERGMDAVRQLRGRMHANRIRRMRQIGLDAALAERISSIHTPNYM